MAEVSVDGTSIHYETTGSGPVLVLLHGLGSSGRDWEYQVGPLADEYQLIIPDLPGHGRSGKPPGPYSISRLADDIAALVEEVAQPPVAVVGISLGGMVGFQLAADRPDLVSRLVVVNALPAFEVTRISQKIQLAIRKVITRRLSMEKIGEVLSKRLLPAPDMAERRKTMAERWAENDKTAYEATFQAILRWPGVAAEMAATEVPITVISSQLDYISPEDKEPYVANMPTASMVVIEGAHHAVPAEYPERFNEVLKEVLI